MDAEVSFHDEQRLREVELRGEAGDEAEAEEGAEAKEEEGAKDEDQFLDVLTDFYNWASERQVDVA